VPRIFAIFFCLAPSLFADEPSFSSKLFESGDLIYSDDFDGEFNSEFWGSPGKHATIEDGILTFAPKFKTKEEAMKTLKRDHHLGLGVVAHIKNIPEAFVMHMRYKVVTDKIVPGRPSFQIGHHMIALSYNPDGGYSLGLPGEKRKWFKEPKAEMKINEWVELVIEYQKGKMLLKVNEQERIFEDAQVTMDNEKDKHSPRFTFKSRDGTEERLMFDYVRIWKMASATR
jgi:hypothetical protein